MTTGPDRPATTPPRAGAGYRISEWLARHMDRRLKTTQTELAEKLRYRRPTMISMMKTGRARVPLEAVEILAEALDVDPSFLLILALEQYFPGREDALRRIFGRVVPESHHRLLEQLGDILLALPATLSPNQKSVIAAALQSNDYADKAVSLTRLAGP